MGMFINKVHGRDMGDVAKTCCIIKSPVFIMDVRVFDKTSFTTNVFPFYNS